MTGEPVTIAVIPVAGLATRMQPLSRAMPKEMLPLGDRPVLHHVIEELIDGGIQHVVFVVGSHPETIERYFHYIPELDGDHSSYAGDSVWDKLRSCTFTFVRQDVPNGVADAVSRAHWIVREQPYLVHMGDSIIHNNGGLIRRMIACHVSRPAAATIAVSWQIPHPTSASAVAEPTRNIEESVRPFEIRRFHPIDQPPALPSPFVIGRYILNGPMPEQLAAQHHQFGGLTPLMRLGNDSEEAGSVMAVPLTGDELLLGAGSIAEYLASWEQILAWRER